MTTTIQLLQDLETELEQHVSDFEQEVLRHVKELEAGASAASPEPRTGPPEKPQTRGFGVGAPWQGRFNPGGLERGGSTPIGSDSTSANKKGWRWKGLRGIWNWLMHGKADGPSGMPKPKGSNPWTKDDWKKQGWKLESNGNRPTLTEYLETQKRFDQFADELISEIIDRTAGQDASDLEGHPTFGPLFRSFRQKIRDTFNRYRRQFGDDGGVTASDFPSEPEPNHEVPRNDIEDDERSQLNDPKVTQGAFDDTSDEDIEAAHAADARKNKLFSQAQENLDKVIASVKSGNVEEPNASWFTGKNKIKKYKLPHVLAWLISDGSVDDPNDGGRRPVNILSSTEVREALRATGYAGPGNILGRLASHLGIAKDEEAIRNQILMPLGWQHGATPKPKPVGTGDVSKTPKTSKPTKKSGGSSWKNKSLSDIVDDTIEEPDDGSDEPSDEELAAMHQAAGFVDDETENDPAINPDDLDTIEPEPDTIEPEPEPRTEIKPKPSRKGSLEALTDKMVSILDKIKDEDKKAELAKGWSRIKKRLKDDSGNGDYTLEDLLDYLKTAEGLANIVRPKPTARRVSKGIFSHYDPEMKLNNESALIKIKASRLKPEELKEFYKSLLRG